MTQPRLTLDALLASPDFHLHAFEGAQAAFARMDRAAYQRSIFLDARIQPAQPGFFGVATGQLAQASARMPAAAPGWIFHIAQCGSTLLARALDDASRTLVLREPVALRQLGVARAQQWGQPADPGWQAMLRLTGAMLARRYRADAPAIVKANVPVNFIAAECLRLAPAPALFLYFPLEAYLAAILRSEGHRRWLHGVTGELRPAITALAGDPVTLADGPRAAALWLAQMRIYAEILTGSAQARSVEAGGFFAGPRTILAAAFAHFGVDMPPAALDAVVAGPLFATYSKDPSRRFDNAEREAREAESLARLKDEIAAARDWLAAHEVPQRLPRPLTGEAPRLLG